MEKIEPSSSQQQQARSHGTAAASSGSPAHGPAQQQLGPGTRHTAHRMSQQEQ